MILKTRIFELQNGSYKSLSELAQAMEISISQIYHVRQGKRSINQKFLLGAVRAFPNYKIGELFYFAPELPPVTNTADNGSARHLINRGMPSRNKESRVSINR